MVSCISHQKPGSCTSKWCQSCHCPYSSLQASLNLPTLRSSSPARRPSQTCTMKAKRCKLHQNKQAVNGDLSGTAGSPLLDLPVELLHQVLGMLGPSDQRRLLQTSKAIAREMMVHRSGSLTLRLQLQKAVKMAAVKKLLQWAPPSCLKLEVVRGTWFCWRPVERDCISSLFCGNRAKHASARNTQHFPCIVEVCLMGFTLPALVPSELAAVCPNLQTLKLRGCCIVDSIGSSYSKNSTFNTSVRPAEHLHTLKLDRVNTTQLEQLPSDNAGVTRSLKPAATSAGPLRSSVTSLTCLKLFETHPIKCIISPLACVLVELRMPEERYMARLQRHNMASMLQGLHKLVMPRASIMSSDDLELLLSLHNLTHVELRTVCYLRQDYRSHAASGST